MALTPSNMLPLGTQAPSFTLPDTVSDKNCSLDELKSDKATLIMFICNHCPFVKHLNAEFKALDEHYTSKGLQIIAISSNDVNNYPDDGPEQMKQNAQDNGWNFPYLYDASQEVAKAYDAACTPDFYLFDKDLKLVYRGRYDASTPGNDKPVNGEDLKHAIEAILNGESVSEDQQPSVGCNIKWK